MKTLCVTSGKRKQSFFWNAFLACRLLSFAVGARGPRGFNYEATAASFRDDWRIEPNRISKARFLLDGSSNAFYSCFRPSVRP